MHRARCLLLEGGQTHAAPICSRRHPCPTGEARSGQMKVIGPGFVRYVYGVFDADFRCVYVGQTRNQTSRSAAHCRRFGEAFQFVVLFACDTSPEACELETTAIEHFRANGHAIQNKRKGYGAHYRHDEFPFVPFFQRIDTGEYFASYSHIAHVFGCSPGSVSGWFRAKDRRNPDGTANAWKDGHRITFRILFPGSC